MKNHNSKKKKLAPISDYDQTDTSGLVDQSRPLSFEDIGLELPKTPPTQVVSIRLPSNLLNELRAIGSAQDIPYQALIKLLLAEGISELKKKVA